MNRIIVNYTREITFLPARFCKLNIEYPGRIFLKAISSPKMTEDFPKHSEENVY